MTHAPTLFYSRRVLRRSCLCLANHKPDYKELEVHDIKKGSKNMRGGIKSVSCGKEVVL
jgi:hypothetical protein